MKRSFILRRENIFSTSVYWIVLSLIAVGAMYFTISQKSLIGPAVILLGLLCLAPLRFVGREVKSVGADIIFGATDTGIMVIFALVGASLVGVLGAVVGAGVGDAITDGFAGIFEGRMAEWLRAHNIDEARTPLSSSMGKMSGCLLGAGITLSIAWAAIGL